MRNHIICICVSLIIAVGVYYLGTQHISDILKNNITSERCTLQMSMRRLWSDHAWWTRNYLITAIADMPDIKATTDRLLKNQEDLGNAIVRYYGKEAGSSLTILLREHILIAADVVASIKENDTVKFKKADTKWHANADDIALFLDNINPYWPKEEMQKMMYKHLKLITEEAAARLKQDWMLDIEIFEKMLNEILMMADSLTDGIAKQFPGKF